MGLIQSSALKGISQLRLLSGARRTIALSCPISGRQGDRASSTLGRPPHGAAAREARERDESTGCLRWSTCQNTPQNHPFPKRQPDLRGGTFLQTMHYQCAMISKQKATWECDTQEKHRIITNVSSRPHWGGTSARRVTCLNTPLSATCFPRATGRTLYHVLQGI